MQFTFLDDQSDPKVALQLAQGLLGKTVILGPSSPQDCAAVAPIVAERGPVMYCLANAGNPVIGGYEFLTLFPYEPQFAVTLRYFRSRGLHRIAYLVSTDAGGQDAERAMLSTAALPENKSIEIVAREHFTPGDLSTTAQLSQMKAANPDVLLLWATGAAAGTMFRGAKDLGIDLPTFTSPGNLNAAFFKQYATLLPTNLYFATVPYYAGDQTTDPATRAAIATLTAQLATVNAKPDVSLIAAWDPAMVVVDALRKLGPDATAAQLHSYLVGLTNWVGVNGLYNFRANPQRGIGQGNIVMVRWDAQANQGIAVSKFGGAPLPGK